MDQPNATTIEKPVAGHYIIGFNAQPVMTDDGYLVPPKSCHITPELPSEILLQILEDRGDLPTTAAPPSSKKVPAKKAAKSKTGGDQ